LQLQVAECGAYDVYDALGLLPRMPGRVRIGVHVTRAAVCEPVCCANLTSVEKILGMLDLFVEDVNSY
jgi:hypothetical protein